MSNVVRGNDVIYILEHGCPHNHGNGRFGICRACAADIRLYILRLEDDRLYDYGEDND